MSLIMGTQIPQPPQTPQSHRSLKNPPQNPIEAGFYMPPEWHPHEATWLAWPHNETTWPKPQLDIVQAMYIKILSILLPNERVNLLIENKRDEIVIRGRLDELHISIKKLNFHLVPTKDAWIRDYGPTFLTNSNEKKAWCNCYV